MSIALGGRQLTVSAAQNEVRLFSVLFGSSSPKVRKSHYLAHFCADYLAHKAGFRQKYVGLFLRLVQSPDSTEPFRRHPPITAQAVDPECSFHLSQQANEEAEVATGQSDEGGDDFRCGSFRDTGNLLLLVVAGVPATEP
jgi:hypothetical protein